MNILYLNNGLAGGGIEKLLNDLLPIISEQNHCELLILSDKNEKYIDSLRNNGIRITVVPAIANNIIKKYKFIKKYILNSNYDVIHANGFPMIYYIAIIKKFLRKKCPPVVITEHNTDNRRRHHRIFRPIERFIYGSFAKVISISPPTQTALINWLKITGSRTEDFSVIYNGIPVEQFRRAEPVERSRLIPGIKANDFILCMVGTFTEKKNHKIMIPVMKKLPDNYILLCLGEGPLKEDIQKEVYSNGLTDRFVFLGFRKDVASVIKASNAVVIPSIWEGFGLIAVEAMACCIPVIAANVPGLSDIVGNAGILVNPNDSNDIVKAIIEISKENHEESYVKKGNERACEFDILKMAKQYICIYTELCQNSFERTNKCIKKLH